jgi:hypothetical protein
MHFVSQVGCADNQRRRTDSVVADGLALAAQVMEELQGVKDDIAGAESLAAQLGDLQLSLEVLELEVGGVSFS